MGNCCTSTDEGGIHMRSLKYAPKSYKGTYIKGKDKVLDVILDDREVLGFKGEDKIILIARIQAITRSFIAKRRVNHIRT